MSVVEVTEEDAEDRTNGDGKSAVATIVGRSQKKKRTSLICETRHILCKL